MSPRLCWLDYGRLPVCFYVVMLGATGTIHNGPDTLLMGLGVHAAKVTSVLRTLHLHAVHYALLHDGAS